MYRLSPKAHTRFSCLLRLDIPLQLVELPILDKATSCSAEYKCHIIIHTFLPQELHPIVMAGSCTVVILTVAENLLDLPRLKIFSHTDLTDEWSAHHALVLERKFKQYGDTLVCTPLIFGCHIKKDIIPEIGRAHV